MQAWKNILNKVKLGGEIRQDRTGTGTLALFAEKIEFDNEFTFPAVTLKKLAFKSMAGELACFLKGEQNLKDFHNHNCKVWDGNGNADYWKPKVEGDLGRIYGVQWKDWRSIGTEGNIVSTDQIKNLVDGMKKSPHGRRHVVTALNPGELDQMCLPPCHVLFQAFVRETTHVDLVVYMRSVDLFLGLPFDVASYALLQRLLAKDLGLKSGKLTFFTGDTHIYLNHMDQVNEVLRRVPHFPPMIELSEEASLFNFHPSMVKLVNYDSFGALTAPLSV